MSSNPYFDFSEYPSRFAPGSLARAEEMNAVFDTATTGFDAVKAAVDLKAPIANPTFTGSVLVPSPGAVSEDSQKAASTAWVKGVIGSMSVGLPPQAGSSGVLWTDGVSARWSATLPWLYGGYEETTVTVDRSLSASDPTFYDLSQISGPIVKLPDATTLPAGALYTFTSSVDTGSAIADGAGNIFFSPTSNEILILRLVDNSTAAGEWKRLFMRETTSTRWQQITVPSTSAYAAAFSGALLSGKNRCGMHEISSGVYLCAGGGTAASGVDVRVVTVSGIEFVLGSVVSVGTDTVAWLRVLPVTGGYVVLYATTLAGAVKGFAVTVSGTTVSAGSVVTVLAAIDCTGEGDDQAIRAESNGTDVLLVAKTTTTAITAVMVDITSTTLNVGSSATVLTASGTIASVRVGLCSLSASGWGLALAVDETAADAITVLRLTYSGLTITAGTAANFAATLGPLSVQPVSATSMLLFNYVASANAARVISSMDTTPVANAAVTLTTSATGTGYSYESAKCGSYYAAVIEAGSTYVHQVSVSGTTVAQVGSSLSFSGTTASSVMGVAPFWDGTHLHVAARTGSPSNGVVEIGAGGPVLVLSPSLAGGSCDIAGARHNFPVDGRNKVVVFSSAGTAQISRSGVIT